MLLGYTVLDAVVKRAERLGFARRRDPDSPDGTAVDLDPVRPAEGHGDVGRPQRSQRIAQAQQRHIDHRQGSRQGLVRLQHDRAVQPVGATAPDQRPSLHVAARHHVQRMGEGAAARNGHTPIYRRKLRFEILGVNERLGNQSGALI